jgi:hypothetical protein
LRRDRRRVETSLSGGRKKTRTTRGLPARIMKRPPIAANNEKTRRIMRRTRYPGPDMTASFGLWRLYV